MTRLAYQHLLSACLLLTVALVWAQDYVPVDQEISDEEVLRLVDTSYPGLDKFAEAMGEGDLTRAHQLLVEHFATRTRPVLPPAEFPGVGEGNSMIVLRGSAAGKQTADEKWLKHVFTIPNNDIGKVETFQLGPVIQWMESPSKALNWTGYLNQLNIISKLTGVYQGTGEEKYAREAGEMMVSWVQQVHRAYGYTLRGKYVPSGMEVRNRLCNCIAAYEVLRASESITPAMHMAFWKLFITCCRELMIYSGVSYPGLIPAAVMYPEFCEWPDWLEAGRADLEKQLVGRVTPEGAWDTHSISYQTVPVPWAGRSLELLRANPGVGQFGEVEQMVVRQAGLLLELMLRIAMPNGGLPNIGDTYGRTDWSSGAIIPRLESYIHLRMDAESKERLAAIDDPYSRMKAALAIADGAHGDEPAVASMAFPGTGYYVMRTGWEPRKPLYLYFDLSAQAMGHAHNDAGHFELYGYGKPLLTDTGDYFLGWGYRTALHNTVEVDGQQQARGAKVSMEPIEWLSTPDLDFADGTHRTYAHLGVRHRRSILFVKPDYAIVTDLLTGEGAHKFEQFFHFAGPAQSRGATATIDPETLSAASSHEGVANVQVVPVGRDGLEAGFAEAHETDMSPGAKYDREAMLGWIVTGGTFQRARSAVAVYTREGECPQAFHCILFPTPPDATARLTATSLPVIEGGAELSRTDAVCIQLDYTMDAPALDPDEISTDLGANLAAGKDPIAEINETSLASDLARLTDGELGPRRIGAAVSSYPYTPGVELSGRFGLDFGEAAEVNTLIAHHGTWNGQKILYAPETMAVQYWRDGRWHDVPGAETVWGGDEVSSTSFEPVTTTRISVRVERPAGGRLAMREVLAYRVADEETERVARLRQVRELTRWTDTIMLSHGRAAMRRYGDFEFDGELAVVRRSENGEITRLMLKGASKLRDGDAILVSAGAPMDWLNATWTDDAVQIECPYRPALGVIAQGRDLVRLGAETVAAAGAGGVLSIPAAPEAPTPTITDLEVELHPAQKGLAGGQPWAVVSWTTDQPCTSQVEFSSGTDLTRRTVLAPRFVTRHTARVDFLIPGEEYRFTARSVNRSGGCARTQCAP